MGGPARKMDVSSRSRYYRKVTIGTRSINVSLSLMPYIIGLVVFVVLVVFFLQRLKRNTRDLQ